MLRALFGAAFLAIVVVGCASQESLRAEQTVAQRLKCPRGDIESGIQRETPKVREWVVGCNFIYARVHCTDSECHPAPPEPPCIGDLPCFKEDPVTLEWTLADQATNKERDR
jgi:hypothetical protein